MSRVTVSAIKADVGGYVGHRDVHPHRLEPAALVPLVDDGRWRARVLEVVPDAGDGRSILRSEG